MDKSGQARCLYEGKHIKMLELNGWEYVQRTRTTGIVVIIAVTEDNELLFVEQHRPPVNSRVIEFPAGLAGDVEGSEDESLSDAAMRELLEETGYRATKLKRLAEGPVSAGLSTEMLTLFFADNVRREGPGGGDHTEEIIVHAVPLDKAESWLRDREADGAVVDVKVYAGLYFAMLNAD